MSQHETQYEIDGSLKNNTVPHSFQLKNKIHFEIFDLILNNKVVFIILLTTNIEHSSYIVFIFKRDFLNPNCHGVQEPAP